MPPEESPRLFIILVPHQHSHPPRRASVPPARICSPKDRGAGNRRGRATALILLPDDTEEERTGTVHDCNVGEFPIAVVWNQRFDDEGEEGVVGDGAHGIIRDTGGVGAANPGWVGEKRVETAVATLCKEQARLGRVNREVLGQIPWRVGTYIIEVDVYTAIMCEYKIADSVSSLYRLGVIVEGV